MAENIIANITDLPAPPLTQAVTASGATISAGVGWVYVSYNGAVSLALPSTPSGQNQITVSDRGGHCSGGNTITVTGTINAGSSFVMSSAYESVTLFYDGTKWGILSHT